LNILSQYFSIFLKHNFLIFLIIGAQCFHLQITSMLLNAFKALDHFIPKHQIKDSLTRIKMGDHLREHLFFAVNICPYLSFLCLLRLLCSEIATLFFNNHLMNLILSFTSSVYGQFKQKHY